MSKEIVFNENVNKVFIDNVDIFKYEYSEEITKKQWNDFLKKSNCGSCRKEVYDILKKDSKKFNRIISRLMGEDLDVYFPAPLESAVVKEFDSLPEMEKFLDTLKRRGKIIKNMNVSPNSGKYILTLL